MVRLLLMVPLIALGGCKTENPAYCGNPANAGTQACSDAGSGGPACKQDDDCKMTMGRPACDTMINQGTCEQCTSSNHTACMGTTPRCENDGCVACVDDVKDCQGGVCLTTGDCADTSRIIHVRSDSGALINCGDTTATACALKGALAATTGKDVIKLDDPGPFTEMGFTVSNDVTIDARGVNAQGATLTRSDDKGAVLIVMSGKTLTLLGGTIQGARGGMGSAILCNGATVNVNQTTITTNEQFGIDATNCMLTVTGARIENNANKGVKASGGSVTLARTWLDTNGGGGIDVNTDAQFTIVGNVFVNNGTPAGIIGGIGIATTASNNRLEFNSVAENKAQTALSAGITCSANVGFVAKNNIIWSNNSSVAAMAGIQVSGGCGHSYSDIGPLSITGSINIGNNQNNDPKFKDKAADLHLTSASPLQQLQQYDPGSSLMDIAAKDIDGEPRVAPVYIGADQPPKP